MPETPITEDPLREVVIRLDPVGRGSVVVDGVTIEPSSLHGVEVRAFAAEPTQVALHVRQGKSIEFEGEALVTVVEHEQGADPAAVAGWLARIDPATLEATALNRLDLEMGENGLVKTMMRQLIEWASGK